MTSISDRCKAAQEGAKAGPWEVEHDQVFDSIVAETGYPVATDIDRNDSHIIALAPEAADEVIRLTRGLEALAEWHDNEAELTGHLGRTPAIMRLSNQHTDAAARIRSILNPNGGTND